MHLLVTGIITLYIIGLSNGRILFSQNSSNITSDLCVHSEFDSDCAKETTFGRIKRAITQNDTHSKTRLVKGKGHAYLKRMRVLKRRPVDESRVQKYSYYYISQKIWHIPLYFMIYFCCYFGLLVIKSISREKAKLRIHFGTKDKPTKRSVESHDLTHETAMDFANYYTPIIMSKIYDFKEMYLKDILSDKKP